MRVSPRLLFLPGLLWPDAVSAQTTAEQALAHAHVLTAAPGCAAGRGEEIVVCGGGSGKYRLPFPEERAPREDSPRPSGDIPRASAEAISYADCGIFQGQRRCGKAESRRYGYGGGNDPLSFAIKLGTKILDPDADVGAPKPLPGSMPTEPR